SFEGAVHPFMTPVLLGTGWLGPFMRDPKPHPPNRQLAQAGQGARGERCAVVGADTVGQPALSEDLLEYGLGRAALGALQGFAADDVATDRIGDGQRIAVLLIAQPKLALEVRTPELVRSLGVRERRAAGGRAVTSTPRLDEARTLEEVTYRAWG